jgi:dihydrofolate reductase
MNTPRISIIVAVQRKDNAIGFNNDLILRISDDLKRVKALTTGHAIVTDWSPEGLVVVHSLDEALTKAREIEIEEIFIFGGGEIYRQILPQVDRIYMTIVDGNQPATVFFPDWSHFDKVIEQHQVVDQKTNTPYEYLIVEK